MKVNLFRGHAFSYETIAGFTRFSEKIAPEDLVKFLNEVFSKFDELTETDRLEKIKMIGDAYMVAGGVSSPLEFHSRRICQMALKMQEVIKDLKDPERPTFAHAHRDKYRPGNGWGYRCKEVYLRPLGRYREYRQPYGITF